MNADETTVQADALPVTSDRSGLLPKEREDLAEAWHEWDHPTRIPGACSCVEFVDDFGPLIAEFMAERAAR